MTVKLNIHIEEGTDIGGANIGRVNPFVVVCFDNNIDEELHKSSPARSDGNKVKWDETFVLDLTNAMKNAMANGHPEPTYLTFNVFDASVATLPTLGSAGVLLSTVRDQGFAQGSFPVVNGSGSLSLTVGDPPKPGWVHTKAAKKAGIATAVGVGALALGFTARHYHNKKKETKNENIGANPPPPPGPAQGYM